MNSHRHLSIIILLLSSLITIASNLDTNPFPDNILGGKSYGIVGSTPYQIDVQSNGRPYINIPINLPSSPLCPDLSIMYDGGQKEGMLGWNMALSGLSKITRTFGNNITDGYTKSINLDSNDCLSLDGIRLLQTDESINQYYLEYNDVSQIFTDNSSNPKSFTVKRSDGTIAHYGTTDNSRMSGHDSEKNICIYWMLDELEDRNGNYYKVSYNRDSLGECVPSQIKYGLNKNFVSTDEYTIDFKYRETGLQTNSDYVSSCTKFRNCFRLSEIIISNNSERIKSYTFRYNNSYGTILESIIEVGNDGKSQYNPINFNWSNADNYSYSEQNANVMSALKNTKIRIGDFNGDGYDDILAIPGDNSVWSNWNLYTRSSNGNLALSSYGTFPTSETIQDILVGDFLGDGKSDILIKRYNQPFYNYFLFTYSENDFKRYNSFAIATESQEHFCNIGDFNGDGKADIYICYSNSTKSYVRISPYAYPYDERSDAFQSNAKWEQVVTGDFNGDGLMDIMNIHNLGFEIVYSDGKHSLKNSLTGNQITSDHKIVTGDFNGDGKTDILVLAYKDEEWNYFIMYYGTYNGTLYQEKIHSVFNPKTKSALVVDLNHDGKDEIITVRNKSDILLHPELYELTYSQFYPLPFNCSTGSYEAGVFAFGNFSGKKKTDFIYYYTPGTDKAKNTKPLFFAMDNVLNPTIESVNDCLGNLTKFEYKCLTDNSAHIINETFSYPLRKAAIPFEIVTKIEKSDGMGGFTDIEYTYYNGSIQTNRHSFVGFKKIRKKENAHNSMTESYFEFDSTYCLSALCRSAEYGIAWNNIRTDSYYTNTLTTLRDGTKAFSNSGVFTTYYDHNTNLSYLTVREQTKLDSFGFPTYQVRTINSADSVTTETTYAHDVESGILGIVTKSEQITERHNSDPIAIIQDFEYDKNYNITKQIEWRDGETTTTLNKYDYAGNCIERSIIAGEDSRTTKYTYSGYKRLLHETDPEGYTSSYSYYADGLIHTHKNMDGIESEYEYDAFQHPIKETIGNKKHIEVSRWSNGIIGAPENSLYLTVSQTEGEGAVITFYDSLGRKLREKTQVFGGKSIYRDWVYNPNGTITKESLPYFSDDIPKWNTFNYDGVERMVKKTFFDGKTETHMYVSNGRGEDTEYGHESYDRYGHYSLTGTNAYGQRIKVYENDYRTIDYIYDSNGLCTSIKAPGKTINMGYDGRGNRTSLDDPDTGEYVFTYNGFGQKKTKSNLGGNNVIEYEYDNAGQMISMAADDCAHEYTYHTSRKGVLLSSSYDSSASDICNIYYEYDDQNNPIKEIRTDGNKEYTTEFEYDQYGRPSTITYPNGLKITKVYDQNGVVSMIKSGQTTIWTRKTVNEQGITTNALLGNGIAVSRTYDKMSGNLSAITHGDFLSHGYAFDDAGNIASISTNSDLKETFTYDKLDRLTAVSLNGETKLEIKYDRSGNIVSKTDVGIISYSSSNNHIESITLTEPSSLRQWSTIEYDKFHRLSKVQCPNVANYQISYGADGQKWKISYGRYKKYYAGNLYEETEETNGRLKTTTECCRIFVDGELIAMVMGNSIDKIFYVHTNHLGSIEALSDASGKVIATYSYDAWGKRRNPTTFEPINQNNSILLRAPDLYRGYCGHEHMDQIGLINMNGRLYDPVMGRFLSPDPYVQQPDNTQNLNRYVYCINNPLLYKDASGEWFFIDDFIIGAIKGLIKGKNPLKTGWQQTKNSFNIWKGLFTTGSARGFFGKTWELISRFTWQLPQTTVGLLTAHTLNTYGSVNKIETLYGATVLQTNNYKGTSAVTLGNFIIGGKAIEADPSNSIFQHEYGHYLQSQSMGIGYFGKVGIPSFLNVVFGSNHRYQKYEMNADLRSFIYFN